MMLWAGFAAYPQSGKVMTLKSCRYANSHLYVIRLPAEPLTCTTDLNISVIPGFTFVPAPVRAADRGAWKSRCCDGSLSESSGYF